MKYKAEDTCSAWSVPVGMPLQVSKQYGTVELVWRLRLPGNINS